MAAEIADGWLPLYYSPHHQDVYAESLAGAGPAFDIVAGLQVNIDDDVERALAPVKAMLGFYIGGMGAKGTNYHTNLMSRFGYEAEAAKIQELFFEGAATRPSRPCPTSSPTPSRCAVRPSASASAWPRGTTARCRRCSSTPPAASRRCPPWPTS